MSSGTSTETRALSISSFEGIESAALTERTLPPPAAGEVTVRIKAAAIHPLETLVAAGSIPFATSPPLVLGAVGAGEIVGGSESFADGDRVAIVGNELGMTRDGIWADHAVVPERLLLKLPDGVDFEAAACIGIGPPTAAIALELGAAPSGASVLVLGATGAVGSAALQLALDQGLRPTAVSRSTAGCAFCETLGAPATVDLSARSLADAAASDGRFDLVIDAVGGEFTAAALGVLKPGGTHVVVGHIAGPSASIFLPGLVASAVRLVGGHMGVGGPDKLREAELISLDALSSGTMAVPVAATFGLDQLQAAYAAAADPDLFGRILLVP